MIKFLANNLVESAVLTASTTNAQFPLANIKNDFRTKVWRSTSNTDNIIFDLGSIEDVDSIAIVDNWKSGFGISTVTIEANGTSDFSSPAFSTTLTFDVTHGIGIKEFTTESFRFWRLVLTSTLGFCELPYVFIGVATTLTTNGVGFGYALKERDIKKFNGTRYGQEYIDDLGTRKELNNLSFELFSNTELDKLFELLDDRRSVKPFILKLGDGTNTIISNENRLNGLYKVKNMPSIKARTIGLWDVTFSVKEQL